MAKKKIDGMLKKKSMACIYSVVMSQIDADFWRQVTLKNPHLWVQLIENRKTSCSSDNLVLN
jgi:hypothetical protein